MTTPNNRVVTVFGGTGFLGRRVVQHLRLHEFCVRVASRHPERGYALLHSDDPHLQLIKVDVHDEQLVADAVANVYGVVNAVSLYVEQGRETFHSVHVESAQRVQLRRSERVSSGLSMFRGLVPILARSCSISERAAKANWQFGRPLPMPF